jgi:hypothetical protein
MNPIWCKMKKCSPSSGQNDQLVHWWLLVGWSELTPTNAPVEDEPVQPVLRMNILPTRCVFFFTSSLPHLPPPSYFPSPTYHLPTPSYPKPTSPSYLPPTNPTPPHSIARARLVERPLTPSPELDLWNGSSSCGVVAVELWSWSRSSSAHQTHAPTIR